MCVGCDLRSSEVSHFPPLDWHTDSSVVETEENSPTELLRCTFVTYLLHTLFLVLYMQTKQFLKNFFFVLDTNTLDYDVHIYGFWLDTVDLAKAARGSDV